jgi:plasmid maintenance system killer protein
LRFVFEKRELLELYTSGKGKGRYPAPTYKAFFRRVSLIRGAKDIRDLRAVKGAHLEKIQSRPGMFSMRLDEQYRLEMAFDKNKMGKTIVVIKGISKHYGE